MMETDLSATPRYPLPGNSAGGPGESYAELLTSSPVTRVILPSGDEVWMVTRYDDVRAVLSDPRFSNDFAGSRAPRFTEAEGPPPAGTVMTTDPPEHTRIRQVAGRMLSPRRVAAFRPAAERIADELLDAMSERIPPADLIGQLAPLP